MRGLERGVALGRRWGGRAGGVEAVREAEGDEPRECGMGDATEAQEADCAGRGGGGGAELAATEEEGAPVIFGPL